MSTVRFTITTSLDGFVAGPSQSEENPIGVRGVELHRSQTPLGAFRRTHGEDADNRAGGWRKLARERQR